MDWLFSLWSRFVGPLGWSAVFRARREARRRRERKSPEKLAVVPTGEVFRDPATGQPMQLWMDMNDGSRFNLPMHEELEAPTPGGSEPG
jgi:hypothetical protein